MDIDRDLLLLMLRRMWMIRNFELKVMEVHSAGEFAGGAHPYICLLYTSPSPRDVEESRMPSSA